MTKDFVQWWWDVARWVGDDESRARHMLEVVKAEGRREVTPTPPVDPGST